MPLGRLKPWDADRSRRHASRHGPGHRGATLGFVALIPTVVRDLQFDTFVAGVIPGVTYLAALLVAVPAGRAADLLPANRLILGAHVNVAGAPCSLWGSAFLMP